MDKFPDAAAELQCERNAHLIFIHGIQKHRERLLQVTALSSLIARLEHLSTSIECLYFQPCHEITKYNFLYVM